MATPDQVRAGLVALTGSAAADARTVATAANETPQVLRAALFEAAPLIVGDHIDGAAALALDWYEERRLAAAPRKQFSPVPRTAVDEDALRAAVAVATEPLYNLERTPVADELYTLAIEQSLAALDGILSKDVATGFWGTIIANTSEDPAAQGWQRYARSSACGFCRMLADRGAVYSERTVHFAAHNACHCIVGPSFDPAAPRPTVMQYVASKRQRTAKERADLRAYLHENYPDSPG